MSVGPNDTWLTVTAACEIADVLRILPPLVEWSWTTPSQLAANRRRWTDLGLSSAEQTMLQVPLARWLTSQSANSDASERRDLPRCAPSTGGSLKRALEAAQANQSSAARREHVVRHGEIPIEVELTA